jgi:hypothetical protein
LSIGTDVEGHVDGSCDSHRSSWNNVVVVDQWFNMHRWRLRGLMRGFDLRNLRSTVATIERVKTVLQVSLGLPARNAIQVLCTALSTSWPGAWSIQIATTVSAESGTLLERLDRSGLNSRTECTTRAGSGRASELEIRRCHLVVHLDHVLSLLLNLLHHLGLLLALFFQTSFESSLSHSAGSFGMVLDFTCLANNPFARGSVETVALMTDRASALARTSFLLSR